jgi:hypothetical protein
VVVDQEEFARLVAERAAAVPGVLAVGLGGSRAQGLHRPDSNWDFGLYYRGRLDPDDVRALGWPGTVFALGEWGGGVMNGGAWLTVEGRRVDLHYRDLDEVEHHLAEAEQGRFRSSGWRSTWPASRPTWSSGSWRSRGCWWATCHGPGSRRCCASGRRASGRRRGALAGLHRGAYAARGDALGCAGGLARAVIEAAHARLATRGTWALNEKRIVERAGLDGLAPRFARLGGTPAALREAVREIRTALGTAADPPGAIERE